VTYLKEIVYDKETRNRGEVKNWKCNFLVSWFPNKKEGNPRLSGVKNKHNT